MWCCISGGNSFLWSQTEIIADSTHVRIVDLGVRFRAHRKHPPFFSPILSASLTDLLHTAATTFLFETMDGGRKRNKCVPNYIMMHFRKECCRHICDIVRPYFPPRSLNFTSLFEKFFVGTLVPTVQ